LFKTPAEPPPVDAAERARIQRRTLRTLLASQVCGGIGLVSSISVTVLLANDLTGSKTMAALTAACLSIGSAAAAFPLAKLMSRAGRRPGLLAGYTIGAVGTFLAALVAATDFYLLLPVAILAAGAANASNLATRYAAADLAPDDRRASTIGTIVWASTIGSGFGSLLSLSIVDPTGQRLGLAEYAGSYVVGGTLLLCAAAIIAIRLRPDPLVVAGGIHRASQPRLPFSKSMGLILAHPQARVAVIAMALSQAVMVGTMTLTPLHMKDGHQSGTAISVMLFSHIMGMYLFSPFVGILADRVGRYPMLLGAGVLCVVGATSSGMTPPEGFLGVTVGQATIGLAWSFGLISASGLLTESFSVEHRASVQGAGDLCMAACGALAGVSAGGIVSLRSYGDLNAGAAGIGVILIVIVLASVVVRRGQPMVAPIEANI
jgi:MFS family permease